MPDVQDRVLSKLEGPNVVARYPDKAKFCICYQKRSKKNKHSGDMAAISLMVHLRWAMMSSKKLYQSFYDKSSLAIALKLMYIQAVACGVLIILNNCKLQSATCHNR